jgi:hypothetical protein
MWHIYSRTENKYREAPEKYRWEHQGKSAWILKQIKECNAHIPGFNSVGQNFCVFGI